MPGFPAPGARCLGARRPAPEISSHKLIMPPIGSHDHEDLFFDVSFLYLYDELFTSGIKSSRSWALFEGFAAIADRGHRLRTGASPAGRAPSANCPFCQAGSAQGRSALGRPGTAGAGPERPGRGLPPGQGTARGHRRRSKVISVAQFCPMWRNASLCRLRNSPREISAT
jgi:hypothetical protein